MTHTQNHQYFPRITLEAFADNYTPDTTNIRFVANRSTVYEATALPAAHLSSASRGSGQGKNSGRGRRGGQEENVQGELTLSSVRPDHHIKVHNVQDHITTLTDVTRAYAVENMYQGIDEADCTALDNRIATLEENSSAFIRRFGGKVDPWLTRAHLFDLKKFLTVMGYRAEHRWRQYHNNAFDVPTRVSILYHMGRRRLARMQDVWFDNLKWLAETPADDISEEHMKMLRRMDTPTAAGIVAAVKEYQGPVHAYELREFYDLCTAFVCVWEAEEGSEFILSNNCFGTFERRMSMDIHRFYVVSPRYAIVLVNRECIVGTMKSMASKMSWFRDRLRPVPLAVYKKRPDPTSPSDFTPDDVFKYQRGAASKRDVHLVNSILLDTRPKYLTFKSSLAMYKTLRYYDEIKHDWNMFECPHDYSHLKRELFADMNRTHS
ncbi:hypothetical protein DFQ27_009119 [Actinomortierella ambigua]|uniref:Uncharacterized protein n=1 Tax=Actinomortierella ambigua TaxID=1343610 RepID=A0A9P6PS33_9FUNG|nr:hypothetical protein DFQ27_009119 [Actinomortierella ambigua]